MRLNTAIPWSSHTIASASTTHDLIGSARTAAAANGKRLARSLPLRVRSRTARPLACARIRKPSCLFRAANRGLPAAHRPPDRQAWFELGKRLLGAHAAAQLTHHGRHAANICDATLKTSRCSTIGDVATRTTRGSGSTRVSEMFSLGMSLVFEINRDFPYQVALPFEDRDRSTRVAR
jgi:hypothetical protein